MRLNIFCYVKITLAVEISKNKRCFLFLTDKLVEWKQRGSKLKLWEIRA